MMEDYIKKDVIKDKLIVFDTNIFLNFYYYDEWELNSIKKFLNDISLYIWEPIHIKEEFLNAREKKIKEVLQQFKDLEEFFKKENKNTQDFMKNFKRNHMIDIDFFHKYKDIFNYDIQHRYSVQKKYFEKNITRIGGYKYEKNDILLKILNENIFSKIDESLNFNINEYLNYYEKFENYPGKADLEKNNNKYGDFIIWIAMKLKSKKEKKDVIFVTGEKKGDWCDDNGNCHDYLLNRFKERTGRQFIFLDFNELIGKITTMPNFNMLHNFIQERYFYNNTIRNLSPYRNEYSSVAIQDIVMKTRKAELGYLSENQTREWKLLLMGREYIDYKFKDLICGGIENYRYALALPVFTFNHFEPCKLLCKIVAKYVTSNQTFEKNHFDIFIESNDGCWYTLYLHSYLENIDVFFSDKLNKQETSKYNNTYIFNILKALFEINDKLD